MSTPGAVPAPTGRRLVAVVVDTFAAILLGGGFVLAELAAGERSSAMLVLGLVLLTGLGLGQWWALAATGFTIGGRLVGLRLLDERTGRPIGLLRAAGRAALAAIGLATGVGAVGLLVSVLTDPDRRGRGWHDRAVRAQLFDIALGVDPATAPAATAAQARRRVDQLLAASVPSGTAGMVPTDPTSVVPVDTGLVPPAPVGSRGEPELPREPGLVITEVPMARHSQLASQIDPLSEVPYAAPAGEAVRESARPEAGAPVVEPTAEPTAEPTSAPVAEPVGAVDRVVPTAPYEQVQSPAHTALDDEVEQTRMRSARAKVAYVPSRRATAPKATLLLWDNRLVVLDGTALVGRNPAPRAGEELPVHVIPVLDRGRSVSKTHLAIGVDPEGVWLRDRSSTNGTVVTLEDGQQILCAPEQTVRVPVGASVAFGDYWLTVTG